MAPELTRMVATFWISRKLRLASASLPPAAAVRNFALSASVCRPASVIRTRVVSPRYPDATMGSVVAVASPARTSSTISSTVKPCANMIASVQPSRLAASNSSARRRSGLGPRVRLRFVDRRSFLADVCEISILFFLYVSQGRSRAQRGGAKRQP